jgi:AraC family transcriptional regulator
LPASRAAHSSDSKTPWVGRAAIGFGWGYFHGCIGDNQPHQHHAMQIVLASTPLRIWLDNTGWRECHGIIVGPDVCHQLDDTGQAMKVIYLEPENNQTRRIMNHLQSGWWKLSSFEASNLWEQLERAEHHDLARTVANLLCPATSEEYVQQEDEVIQKLLQALPRPLPERLTAKQLAQDVHLSPSRFQHRFAQHTGMAVRPYLRWLRLLTALTAIARNASLTQAAADAGFADAAHFSRTFRRHFGFAPRNLLRMRYIAQ